MASSLLENTPYDEARLLLRAAVRERERRTRLRTIKALFPDDGAFARHLYAKSLEFFRAGAVHRERLLMGGNRTSKTKSGGYEDTLHLTGLYDTYAPWWEGARFRKPVKVWVWGTTDEKVKETVQEELLGPVGAWGTGLIPGEQIVSIERAASPIKDLVDTVRVRHATDGTEDGVSVLTFKSYKQGRKSAEGTFQDVIHGDEEMPLDIYVECLLRTMDTTGTGRGNGLIYITFTPLQGLSEVVLLFLPDGQLPGGEQIGSRYVVNVTWDDVPHLDEASKAELMLSIPPFQRDARTRGLPVLGAGVIYPVSEDDYLVDPFEIPKHWLRAYALDVGWNWTAALWGAYNREVDTWTLYHAYKVSQAQPSVHATAIKAPGPWIPGVIDPAANGRAQEDGRQLIASYRALDLDLMSAANAVEAGLYECWERLSTGRLKIFTSLGDWRKEIRLYRRDERGHVVKVNDHLMDCLAPETPVLTREGSIPIADLVGTEGEVLTVNGEYVAYHDVRLTRRRQQLYQLTFANGGQVACTSDHKFLTPHGWVKAIDMLGIPSYDAITQGIHNARESVCRSVLCPPRARNMLGDGITCAESISNATEPAYIAACGKMPMERSPQACMCTTWTGTAPIMTSATSPFGPMPSIYRTTNAATGVLSPRRLSPKLPLGMRAQPGVLGTWSTISKWGSACTNEKPSSVSIAERALLHNGRDRTDFVPIPVVLGHGEKPEKTMSSASVLCADGRSSVINISLRGLARDHAVIACVSIRESRMSDTYCMAVPDGNAFAIDGGMVVHNCMRYLVMSGLQVAVPFPVAGAGDEAPEFPGLGGPDRRLAWMG